MCKQNPRALPIHTSRNMRARLPFPFAFTLDPATLTAGGICLQAAPRPPRLTGTAWGRHQHRRTTQCSSQGQARVQQHTGRARWAQMQRPTKCTHKCRRCNQRTQVLYPHGASTPRARHHQPAADRVNALQQIHRDQPSELRSPASHGSLHSSVYPAMVLGCGSPRAQSLGHQL